jgi:branched-chain amino acid transport system substrate-binding protein
MLQTRRSLEKTYIEGRRAMRKSMFFSFIAIVLLLGLLITVAPQQSHSAPAAPASIKVGVVDALTGNMAAGGKWVKQGYETAVKHINSTGGISIKEFGKKIPLELVFLDDESNPAKTVSRMEKLYSIDKVDFFLGGFAAHLLIPQLAIAEKYRVPIVVTTIGSTAEFEKGYKYSFTPFMAEQDQVITFLDVLDSIPKNLRPTKIAFFEIQEEWGVATGRYLKDFAGKRGYTIATYEKYAMTANDFSSLIVNAKSAGAEALYTNPSPPQGITIVKQMKEIDWTPKFAYIMRAADVAMWTKNLGKDGDFVCHSGGWDYHLKLPGVQKFDDDYRAAYGDNPEPPAGSAYVCVQVLADALERAGTLNRDKVRDALAATNMTTIMGPMKFKKNGRGEGKYLQTMTQWQNGKDELIWPKDQASAPLAYPTPPWNKR